MIGSPGIVFWRATIGASWFMVQILLAQLINEQSIQVGTTFFFYLNFIIFRIIFFYSGIVFWYNRLKITGNSLCNSIMVVHIITFSWEFCFQWIYGGWERLYDPDINAQQVPSRVEYMKYGNLNLYYKIHSSNGFLYNEYVAWK